MNNIQRSDQNGFAILTLMHPPVNSFSLSVRQQLWQELLRIEIDANIKAVIITGSNGIFSAGADIKEFANGQAEVEPNLRTLITRIEQFPKWIAVAINGTCMGGGFELALGAHVRVADPKAQLALPEVKLGLLPGAGGTQRLPRYIGLEAALNFMVSGTTVKASLFEHTPLLDGLDDKDLVGHTMHCLEKAMTQSAQPKRVSTKPVRYQPLDAFLQFARNSIRAVASAYPAPLKIVEAVKASAQLPLSEGLQLEAQLFESLMLSEESKSLRHVFFSERLSHKLPDLDDHIKPRAIHIVGIVGAGTMGSGIAISVLQAGLKVILVDQSQESLQKGGQSIERIIQDRIAKGKLTPAQAAALQSQLTLTDDWEALKTADLVIEAVFEEFKVKQAVFEKLDRLLKPNALLASNTSTLDINRLAQLTKRPDAVLGLHFFSPAHVMKLLEVVRGASTSKEALATAIQFAKTLKKIPVVAGVCDGFIGNRMLMPYIRMAESMVEQGASPLQVDNALEKFGMVMGPFRVSDLAGLDIGYAIRKRMRQANPSLPLSFSDRLVEAGRLGQKNLMGWYRYEGAKRKHTTDPIVQSMLERFRQDHSLGVKTFTDAEIVERCIYALINEGARCLGEGIALRASDIDLVYIYGYGFPPFRGGPMHYASRVGLQSIIHTLKTLSQQVDPFYSPAPALVEAYQSQQSL